MPESSPAKNNPKTILGWCLYDFANSIYVAVIPATIWQVYFANHVVGNEAGQGDLWWGRAVSTTMLFVAATSPLMGGVADYAGVRKKLLILYTLVGAGGTCLLASVAPGMVLWGFLLTVLAGIGFEGSMVFYNAYLPEIASLDHQGRVSGWGFATGYAGSLLGLLMVLPLVGGEKYEAAFLATGAAYLLFALPAFFWLPPDVPARLGVTQAAGGGFRESWRTFRDILHFPALRRFLLAYFIYEDGVNTVVYFSSLFAAKTLGFSATQLILLFAVVQVSALLGALLWAKPTDRLGPKFVVLAMLVQWSLVVMAAYFVQSQIQFFVVAVLAGTGLGAIQAASRAFMATLIPAEREAEFFGFYTLCGKSASILGPLVFGAISVATGGNQRLAVLSVLLFYLVGAAVLWRVRAGGPTTTLPRPREA
jgi:UMF1 family MFS transporter